MSDDSISSVIEIKPTKFTGKKKDFQPWLQRLKGYSTLKGIASAFGFPGTLPLELPGAENLLSDTNDPTYEEKKRAMRQNQTAVALLTMMLPNDMLYLNDDASSEKWPKKSSSKCTYHEHKWETHWFLNPSQQNQAVKQVSWAIGMWRMPSLQMASDLNHDEHASARDIAATHLQRKQWNRKPKK